MIYDGLEVIPHTIPGNKILLEDVLINGESLELDRIYTVGTIDMFTFGYLYPSYPHFLTNNIICRNCLEMY